MPFENQEGGVSLERYAVEGSYNQQDRTLRRYLKPDLLIIDDMGIRALPKNSGEYLLEIVMRRHENRSTIMTINRPLEEWGKLFGDVPAASAVLDRFLSRAIVVSISGRSYRVVSENSNEPNQLIFLILREARRLSVRKENWSCSTDRGMVFR